MFRATVNFFSNTLGPIIRILKNDTIQWSKTPSPIYPYKATVHGQKLKMRIGEFPEEPLYSILDKKGNTILEADDLYPNWHKNDFLYSKK